MPDTDLIALLDRLLVLPAETELLGFKTAGTSFDIDDLGRYFSALFTDSVPYRSTITSAFFDEQTEYRAYQRAFWVSFNYHLGRSNPGTHASK